jgi:hypothetical protein
VPQSDTPHPQTVADVLAFLGIDARPDPPRWPPDAFAVAVLLLQRSGTYRLAVDRWPPVEACLQILAAADEASAGVGVLDPENPADEFGQKAMGLLAIDRSATTLCVEIDPSRALVLPKMHTPQVGMSIRSLSHHLAYCDAGEVCPRWDTAPKALGARSLVLLVLPWPLEVLPRQFRENPGMLENIVEFKDPHVQEIARGLAGDGTISASARQEAVRIAKWAGLLIPGPA